MGIRIHKKLGWTIPDIKKDDSRINWESIRKINGCSSPKELVRFSEWIREKDRNEKERHSMNHLVFKMPPGFIVGRDLVYCDDEFEELFFLIGDGWEYNGRTDDGIDYVENYLKRENGKKEISNTFDFLPDGYYPYQNFWMLAETGEHLYPLQRCDGIFHFESEVLDNRFGNFPQEKLDKMIVPEIPLVVSDICEFFEVFKDRKTKLQLRPVLATYWN